MGRSQRREPGIAGWVTATLSLYLWVVPCVSVPCDGGLGRLRRLIYEAEINDLVYKEL